MLYYKPLTSMDFIDEWSSNLRLQDQIEIGALNQNKKYIKNALAKVLQKSDNNYVLYKDESVLSILGVRDIDSKVGILNQ